MRELQEKIQEKERVSPEEKKFMIEQRIGNFSYFIHG
jgi:hypothetical protein